MKIFNDLDFYNKPYPFKGVQAIMMFDNGFGISVITGGYGSKKKPYEIAVLDKHKNLCYTTPITNDVIGYLSKRQVTAIMKKIQSL